MKLAAAVLIVALILITGHLSYEDEVREEQVYCDMVSEGLWPDYRGIYDEACNPGEPEENTAESVPKPHDQEKAFPGQPAM